jgi:hypothetical protein
MEDMLRWAMLFEAGAKQSPMLTAVMRFGDIVFQLADHPACGMRFDYHSTNRSPFQGSLRYSANRSVQAGRLLAVFGGGGHGRESSNCPGSNAPQKGCRPRRRACIRDPES